jgi:hypothetical protein
MGFRFVLDAVEMIKIYFPCRGSNHNSEVFQPFSSGPQSRFAFSSYLDPIYQTHVEIHCGLFIIKINSNSFMQWRANLWYPPVETFADPRADFDG